MKPAIGAYDSMRSWHRAEYAADNCHMLRQVVFVHPNTLPGPPAEGVQPGTVDFLCDSSRTVASMVRP